VAETEGVDPDFNLFEDLLNASPNPSPAEPPHARPGDVEPLSPADRPDDLDESPEGATNHPEDDQPSSSEDDWIDAIGRVGPVDGAAIIDLSADPTPDDRPAPWPPPAGDPIAGIPFPDEAVSQDPLSQDPLSDGLVARGPQPAAPAEVDPVDPLDRKGVDGEPGGAAVTAGLVSRFAGGLDDDLLPLRRR
jgi:hypothetical protein